MRSVCCVFLGINKDWNRKEIQRGRVRMKKRITDTRYGRENQIEEKEFAPDGETGMYNALPQGFFRSGLCLNVLKTVAVWLTLE